MCVKKKKQNTTVAVGVTGNKEKIATAAADIVEKMNKPLSLSLFAYQLLTLLFLMLFQENMKIKCLSIKRSNRRALQAIKKSLEREEKREPNGYDISLRLDSSQLF